LEGLRVGTQFGVNNPKLIEEMQGKLLFLKHEAMISRFHAMLELACNQSTGRAELVPPLRQIRCLSRAALLSVLVLSLISFIDEDARDQRNHDP